MLWDSNKKPEHFDARLMVVQTETEFIIREEKNIGGTQIRQTKDLLWGEWVSF